MKQLTEEVLEVEIESHLSTEINNRKNVLIVIMGTYFICSKS